MLAVYRDAHRVYVGYAWDVCRGVYGNIWAYMGCVSGCTWGGPEE